MRGTIRNIATAVRVRILDSCLAAEKIAMEIRKKGEGIEQWSECI